MIRSQAKTIKNLNESTCKRKFQYCKADDSKQNKSFSPCPSARYHCESFGDKLKRQLSEQKDRLNKTSLININKLNWKAENKIKGLSSQLSPISQKCNKIKTEGSQQKHIKYGIVRKLKDESNNILKQQNRQKSLNQLVRKHVESNFQATRIIQQNIQQSIVVLNNNNDSENFQIKDNITEINKRNRTKELSEKKIQLKIKQKNIDSMNNQIYALLDYVKYGRNHHADEINKLDNSLNSSITLKHLQQKQPIVRTKQQELDQSTPNIRNMKPIQSKLELKIDPKMLAKNRRLLQVQSKTIQQSKTNYLNINNIQSNIKQFELYSQRSNPNDKFAALISDFSKNLKNNANSKDQNMNRTYNEERIKQQYKNKYANDSEHNSICTQDSNISLINSKIDKIKQRIQYSQEVTKTLENKYLQNNTLNTQNNAQIERQANRKLRNANQTIIQNKINHIKDQIYQRQPQINRNQRLQSYYQNRIIQNRLGSFEKQKYYQIEQQKPTLNPMPQNNNYYEFDENSFNKKSPINPPQNRKNIKINDYINENKPKFKKQNNFSYDQIVLKFVQVLDEQVQIDKQFRHYRQLFNSLPNMQIANQKLNNREINRYKIKQSEKDKWFKLHQKLIQNQQIYSYSINELKQLIEISAGEGDPFWSASTQPKCNQDIIINRTVELFAKSDSHWKNKIVGFISLTEMQKTGFGSQVLDFSKLGHICIEDLVCFVNLHKNTLYRNRDLLPIFKRFCQANNINYKQNKISYEDVQNVLACGY